MAAADQVLPGGYLQVVVVGVASAAFLAAAVVGITVGGVAALAALAALAA